MDASFRDGQLARPSMAYVINFLLWVLIISLSAVAPTRRQPKLYGFPSDNIFFWIIRGPTSTNGMMFLANTCIGTVNISEIQQEGIEPWDLSKNIYISLYICIIIYIYLETQLILLEVESVPNNSRSQPGHSFSPESACLTPKVCTQCLKTVSISWVSPTLHRSWHRTASQPSFVLLDLPVSPYRRMAQEVRTLARCPRQKLDQECSKRDLYLGRHCSVEGRFSEDSGLPFNPFQSRCAIAHLWYR